MEVRLTVDKQRREDGVSFTWGTDATLDASVEQDGRILLSGDASGLRGLASILLALADDAHSEGTHVHLDDGFTAVLQPGSVEMIVERLSD
jgi:hypothetical protein